MPAPVPGRRSLAFYRPFLPLFGTIFFCLLSVGASLATLPFWVTDRLGGGNLAVGFVVATIAVAAIVARPIAGRLADRRGYKPILMAGTLACAAAGALYFGALHVAVVIPVRLLHGIGEAAVYTAGAAWLVAICPPARRGRVVGLYGTAMWLGITLGALIGELLRDGVGFSGGVGVLRTHAAGRAGAGSVDAAARAGRRGGPAGAGAARRGGAGDRAARCCLARLRGAGRLRRAAPAAQGDRRRHRGLSTRTGSRTSWCGCCSATGRTGSGRGGSRSGPGWSRRPGCCWWRWHPRSGSRSPAAWSWGPGCRCCSRRWR